MGWMEAVAMTRTVRQPDASIVTVLEREPDAICEMCGASAECRPYGPCRASVCFECGMLNEDIAKRLFRDRVEGN